jgi:hypothetical protein
MGAGNPDNSSHSRQPYQIAVTSIFLAISIPAVVLRIWVRKWMINSIGVDDYMMIVALVRLLTYSVARQSLLTILQFAYLVYNAALMEIVAHGGGTHMVTTVPTLRVAIDVSSPESMRKAKANITTVVNN